MRNKLSIFCLLSAVVVIFSCSKDNTPALPTDEEILTQKIEDIIPKEYLDTLQMLGLEVYMGTKPPQMEGSYSVKPHILDTSNIASDRPGYRFTDAIVHLSEQSTSDFSINLIGEDFLKDADTSLVTAISGHDNYFTVYGKVKATSSGTGAYAITGLLLSGIKEGDNIRNLQVGIINIDGSHADATFIKQGEGRVAYDADSLSERITKEMVSNKAIKRNRAITRSRKTMVAK